MAFDVNFYTFSKKERSTAQPTGTGTVYSCTANEPLDLLAPVISLKLALNTSSPPTVYNYARIANFGRYYWITGWEIRDGLWWASLRVDALASWKSQIASNSLYIYRSASSWDGDLVDTLYPETTDVRYQEASFTNPFGGSTFDTTYGFNHVVGLIGKNSSCVQYRIFTWPQLTALFNYLMSDAYYVDVLGVFGSSDTSAKVAVNPLQFIQSVRAYPFNLTSDNVVLETGFYVGLAYLDTLTCYRKVDANSGQETSNIQKTTSINISQALNGHPQQSRGVWLNAVHSQYILNCPPFGQIKLDPVLFANAATLYLTMNCDLTTGLGNLLINYAQSGSDTAPSTPNSNLTLITAPVGVDVPVNQVVQTGYGAHQAAEMLPGILTVAAGVAMENPVMVAGGIASIATNAIGGATESRLPQTNKINSQGALINYRLVSRLKAEYTMLTPDDLAGKGRPLCQVRQISSLSGFIIADSGELSVSGAMLEELNELRDEIAGGFFYE